MTRHYIVRATAFAALALLAACGGSSGSDSDGDLSADGDFSPVVPGASNLFLSALEDQSRIFEGPIVASGNGTATLPPPGSASYVGSGTIFDSSLTGADDTVAELRNRALVATDVTATLNFGGAEDFTITQNNFRNIEGNAVAGSATWTGNRIAGTSEYRGAVSGTIAGTSFATPSNGALVEFFGNQTDSAIIGAFEGGVGSGGTFSGVSLNGTIAAEN